MVCTATEPRRTPDRVRDKDPTSRAGGCTTQPQGSLSAHCTRAGRGWKHPYSPFPRASSKRLSCRAGGESRMASGKMHRYSVWEEPRRTGIVCGRSPAEQPPRHTASPCHPAEEVTSYLLNQSIQVCLMNRTHTPFRGLDLHCLSLRTRHTPIHCVQVGCGGLTKVSLGA